MKLKVVFILFFWVSVLDAKSVMDFSYYTGSDQFNRYSASYITSISTYVFSGINYSFYNSNNLRDTNSFRFDISYVNKNYIFSFKPFYYPEKSGTSSYGFKTGFGIVNGKDEVFTTYYASFSLAQEKGSSYNKRDFITEASVEKNFYDEFFIILRGSLNVNYNKKNHGIYDNMDILSYGYTGVTDYTVYSTLGFNFARSFKPDFNSYLYTGFDRINGYTDNINSYILGLKVFLDEKESYYMDFNYNFADFKKYSNSKFFKVSLGVNF